EGIWEPADGVQQAASRAGLELQALRDQMIRMPQPAGEVGRSLDGIWDATTRAAEAFPELAITLAGVHSPLAAFSAAVQDDGVASLAEWRQEMLASLADMESFGTNMALLAGRSEEHTSELQSREK